MRHVVGFLVCLGFVVVALSYMGLYDLVYARSDRVQATVIATLEADPLVGTALRRAVHFWADVASPDPIAGPVISFLGKVATTALSPVGVVALALYGFLLWLFPT